jgi:hypothetical protein
MESSDQAVEVSGQPPFKISKVRIFILCKKDTQKKKTPTLKLQFLPSYRQEARTGFLPA